MKCEEEYHFYATSGETTTFEDEMVSVLANDENQLPDHFIFKPFTEISKGGKYSAPIKMSC